MKTIIKQSYHFKDFTTEFEQCDFSENRNSLFFTFTD